MAVAISVIPLLVFAQVKANLDYAHITVNASSTVLKVLSNDNTANGILKIDKIPLSNHCKAIINADSTEIFFTPEKDFNGVASFNYTITDRRGNFDCGLATVDVSPSPLPYIQTINLFTRPGEKITFTLPKGFGEPASSNLQGSANWGDGGVGSGVFCFTSRRDFVGNDPVGFSFQKTENGFDKFYEVMVYVVGAPVPELLKDDYVYLRSNGSQTVDLYANDNLTKPIIDYTIPPISDPNYELTKLPNGRVNIIAKFGFKGTFNFDYEVTYSDGTQERATVHTTVGNYEPLRALFDITAYHGVPYELKYNIPLPNINNWTFMPRNNGVTDRGGLVTLNNKSEIVYTPPFDGDSDAFDVEYCVAGTGCKVIKINVSLQPATSQTCVTDCVFSGDANRDGIVDMWDLMTVGRHIGEYGYMRLNTDFSWRPTNGENWGSTLETGVNLKNVDLNGDGIISHLDTTVIAANYGKVNSIIAEKISEPSPIEWQIATVSNAALQGDMVEITAFLGTSTSPVLDAHGLNFSVAYDADMLEENTINVDFLQSSWLTRHDAFLAMSKIVNRGRIEAGIIRSQNKGVSGHGEVVKIHAIVIDDPWGFHIGDKPVVRFRFDDVYIMDKQGRMVQIKGKEITIPVQIAKKDAPMKDTDLITFPNPSTDFMNFYLNGVNNIESLRVVDMMGKEVKRQNNIKSKQATLYFDNLNAGIYIAEVMTEKGKITKKIYVAK